MSTIKMSEKQWNEILLRIKEEYKSEPAVFMIRTRMREVLGFTSRTHRYWQFEDSNRSYDGYGSYITEVHLDFYNEQAATMFMLKYQ